MVTYYRVSDATGNFNGMELPITRAKLEGWLAIANSPYRPLIQDYFPELDNDQREFLMTGITPAEWDEFCGEQDELEYGDLDEIPLR